MDRIAFVLTVALVLVTGAGFAGPALGAKYSCHDTNDESGGFQGEESTCKVNCKKDNIIYVEVSSSDEDAQVRGDFECGGAYANCGFKEKECRGKDGPTQTGEQATCKGESSEDWDSDFVVRCWQEGTGGCAYPQPCPPGDDYVIPFEPDLPSAGVSPGHGGASGDWWSSTIEFDTGNATGLLCYTDGTCNNAKPTCVYIEDRVVCWL